MAYPGDGNEERERDMGKRSEFIGSDLRWTIKMLGTWLGCRGQLFTVTVDRHCRRGSGTQVDHPDRALGATSRVAMPRLVCIANLSVFLDEKTVVAQIWIQFYFNDSHKNQGSSCVLG